MSGDISLDIAFKNNELGVTPSQSDTQVDQKHNQVKDNQQVKEERIYSPFNKDQLDDLISEANKLLNPDLTEMHYVLHDKLNKYYVQVEDATTHQVIREIPPKKFMDMYAAIAEKLGLIVNKRV
ncbi:MAG: flagellar biosynthesis protein FlaG [Bacillales bacterium]|nr:flagellar biosynthesis protein FlaG [Bacillales bacterium]MDF2789369.1 flagellar biosynthesis protein FlaG [Neobacillus sp.]